MNRRIWGPLALYLALSVLLFGVNVFGHFGSRAIASDPVDSSQFMWFFAWWPHALLHGLNPLVTHAIFYPQGFNLTWSTAMPGPSLLLAPVTLAFSPVVTWNVIQLLSPALSAFTAYLLCRHVTGRTWPSVIGGYVFGFSPYMLVHLTGGPYLALVPLVPVMVLLVLRFLEGLTSRRRLLLGLSLTFIGQYLISSEVLATSVLFGAITLLLVFAWYPEHRERLRTLAIVLAQAILVTGLVLSPFLLVFFFGHQYPPGAVGFPTDPFSFVVPPNLVALTPRRIPPLTGSNNEPYLGVPLLALTLIHLWQHRSRRGARVLAAAMAVVVVAMLGGKLRIAGHNTGIPLPWTIAGHLPVLRYAIPVRLSLFLILPVAVIVAGWLAERPRPSAGRLALAAAAIATIVPNIGSSAWNTPAVDPPFFAHHLYRGYLSGRDHVLTVPVWGPNSRWLADAKFPFPITAGYAGNPFPASFTRYPTYETLLTGRLSPDYAAQLRRFVADKRVTAIIVQQGLLGPWAQLFGSLGVRPTAVGGVWLYRLHPVGAT